MPPAVGLVALLAGIQICSAQGSNCSQEGKAQCDDDVLPLLQVSKSSTLPSTPALSAWTSWLDLNRTGSQTASFFVSPELLFLTGSKFFQPPFTKFNGTSAENRDNKSSVQQRRRIARQAISAAAVIMLMMTFSISFQLMTVEYLLSGTCAMPMTVLGTLAHICLAVFSLFRAIFRPVLKCLGFLADSCWRCHRQKEKALSITEEFPSKILQEVSGFLPVDSLCNLGTSSRCMLALSDNKVSYEIFRAEVVRLGLEERWESHCATLQDSKDVLEVTMSAREVRQFLCAQLRQSAEEEKAMEEHRQWTALCDIVRFAVLAVSWFWFSAEVMSLACSENPNEFWGILKAVVSPCIFLFVLEADREHLQWQLLGGLVSLVMLLDLVFDSYDL